MQDKGDGLVDDIFDDDGDDMLLEAGKGAALGDGDSDDDDASIGRIKKRYSQILEDDDDSRGLFSSHQISTMNSNMTFTLGL